MSTEKSHSRRKLYIVNYLLKTCRLKVLLKIRLSKQLFYDCLLKVHPKNYSLFMAVN